MNKQIARNSQNQAGDHHLRHRTGNQQAPGAKQALQGQLQTNCKQQQHNSQIRQGLKKTFDRFIVQKQIAGTQSQNNIKDKAWFLQFSG